MITIYYGEEFPHSIMFYSADTNMFHLASANARGVPDRLITIHRSLRTGVFLSFRQWFA